MSSTDEKRTPKYVRSPENNPEGRAYFNWDDEKLIRWKFDAIKMQEAHVKDNNHTEWFVYTPEERDAIELRILMAIYGIRIPQKDSKRAPSCPLKTYTRDEKLHARKIKKMIMGISNCSDKIHFNVIYISTVTKPEGSDEFLCSEEPIFVVTKNRKFIDKDGKVYQNFEEYKNNNNLPKGVMMFPQNGTYTPKQTDTKDNRIQLELMKTPAAASPIKRIKAVIDQIVAVGGIVLTVTGVVTFFSPALFSATAMTVIQTGSFVLTGYSFVGAVHSVYDKTSRDESIHTEILLLASSAFSAFAGGLNQYWKTEMSKYAREGKTFTEIADKITRCQKNLFVAINMITFISSASTLLSSFIDLWNKKERTWLDYYQFSMALFMTTNVLTKPKTIQGVFELEQMQYLKQIKDNLKSKEAKKEMSIMVEKHSNSDEKAYLIRNFNKIENLTEFFELISKTVSVVTCTADGIAVNDKIDIHPLAFNEIGKAVFDNKMAQIVQHEKSAFEKVVLEEFEKGVPVDKLDDFKKEVEKIKDLPADQRKKEMRNLIKDVKGEASTTESSFDASWERADQVLNENVNEQVKKMVGQLRQGSNEDNQKKDFDRLEELAKKRINGTIEPKEQQELQEKVNKCSRHRKQYFLQSSADHRNDGDDPVKNKSFKDDIQTFTNAKNERLCYRIDVEQVKSDLKEFYGQPNIEDITVNGQRIFADMKIGNYDRFNRILVEYKENGKGLMIAAITLAKDSNFLGKVETAQDIVSITEAINIKLAKVPDKQKETYLKNLASGSGPDYDGFRKILNEKINAVNELDPAIKSQWTSPLSMAYHVWKHEKDFQKQSVTINNYFINYANNLFKTENITGVAHNQTGGTTITYAQSFGTRIHVGFTGGANKTIASHFVKGKPC